jgi:hypothetical protein
MATMIPKTLPSTATVGERTVFNILEKLPPECICYFEANIDGRHPDFVVILPHLGVLVIEVKGWFLGNIQAADSNHVVVRNRQGQDVRHLHPLRQARDYMFLLMDRCRASRHARDLLSDDRRQQGRFMFPFGHVAFMTNINRTQFEREGEQVREVFSPGQVLFKDELEQIECLSPDMLLAAIQTWFEPWWPIRPLSDGQIDRIRSVIHPEIVLPATDLAVLDLRQEERALNIGGGHRILRGVAGSGKTVILLARAMLLAKDAGKRVLLLCFNKELAARFAQHFVREKNVTALHFHRWAARNGAFQGSERRDLNDADVGAALKHAFLADMGLDRASFDAVLIDEGQDFHPSWFECAVLALKDAEHGDLLIAIDGGQNLYGRAFTWASVGIKAAGRVLSEKAYELDRNYRNTRQILSPAAPFAFVGGEAPDSALEAYQVDPLIARREGPKPVYLEAKSRAGQLDRIVEAIKAWLSRGIKDEQGGYSPVGPADIAVLFPRLIQADEPLMTRFLEQLSGVSPVRFASSSKRFSFNSASARPGEGVTVSTIHSAKGLQFRIVVIMWIDLISEKPDASFGAQDAALLYVGMTRAEQYLVLSWSRVTKTTEQLKRVLDTLE